MTIPNDRNVVSFSEPNALIFVLLWKKPTWNKPPPQYPVLPRMGGQRKAVKEERVFQLLIIMIVTPFLQNSKRTSAKESTEISST